MPSKKKKYNARFPAGRIKKIMQTDEEVGKVAQAVPIIISRTLELFVESLLSKAMQVTLSRNAKTLSPSHVKQCILAESRFDFLRDLVQGVPDVSAAEEKEQMNSEETSPNSSRLTEVSAQPQMVSTDSNSMSACDLQQLPQHGARDYLKRTRSLDTEVPAKLLCINNADPLRLHREPNCTVTSATAIDLTKKPEDRPVRTANFYHETLVTDDLQQSVITLNPTYASPQPSTSYTNVTPKPTLQKIDIPLPKVSYQRHNSLPSRTPVTPLINIDFSKNLSIPEIKVLDTTAATMVSVPKNDAKGKHLSRQNSKSKIEVKKVDVKPIPQLVPIDIDSLNSGNLQIDEDYDT